MTNAQGNRGWAAVMVAAILMMLAWATAAPSQDGTTFKLLHSFDLTDGSGPFAPLVQASTGNLFGTTSVWGPHDNGTIFRIDPITGQLTTVYGFCSQSGCVDGANPDAPLVQAADGDFYGTTSYGGSYNNGTVFKVTPGGALTTLHSFAVLDGSDPDVGLLHASDGNFYGSTASGGLWQGGTIFKITSSGALTTLHSFCTQNGCTGGEYPLALIQAADGNFYGTTENGGTHGEGTVFKMTPAGAVTILHDFCSIAACTDGAAPYAGLVQGSDRDFYGATLRGGAGRSCYNGCGTIFKITPAGTLTTLYSFCSQSGCPDGSGPLTMLVQATDGNFYGTTNAGGARCAYYTGGCGTVFSITPDGTLTTLHTFEVTDGGSPLAGLIQDTNGSFYGTTSIGGSSTACTYGCGTVFSLSVGLGPFVSTTPTSGKVGGSVTILGTNLTGATSVTFNGSAAAFTVSKSGTYISATVPAGATTGPVQVVTPSGTLNSNVNFQVLP